MIRVKVCGMTDPGNVKAVAVTKPDFMGFIFYPGSMRYVGKDPKAELFNTIPDVITRVGVFVDEDSDKILDLSFRFKLDMIQLHGMESPGACSKLKSAGLRVVKTFRMDNHFNFWNIEKFLSVCDYFLFDTRSDKPGGSGIKFNWEILEEYPFDKPCFLSGGISPADVGLIRNLTIRGLFAVDINSRFETMPGIKAPGLVKTFIEELKIDQR